MVNRKSSRTKTFSKSIYYMFCLYHFSVKCIIKKNYLSLPLCLYHTNSYATGKPMLQTLPNFMNMFTKLYTCTIIICKKNIYIYFLPLKNIDDPLKGLKPQDKALKVIADEKTAKSHVFLLMQINYPYIVWNNVPKFHEHCASSF